MMGPSSLFLQNAVESTIPIPPWGSLCLYGVETGYCVCSLFVSYSLQPHGLQPTRLLCSWDSPAKNSQMSCNFLLKGIFPTQGSNLCLLHLLHQQTDSLPLEPPGNSRLLCRVDPMLPWLGMDFYLHLELSLRKATWYQILNLNLCHHLF